MAELPDLTRCWDVVIIGTGVGGATVGRELALSGLSVLFLEKGTAVDTGCKIGEEPTAPEARVLTGWWPHPVSRRLPDGRHEQFFAAIGCGLGGSSIYYAAALERMAPSDFDPQVPGAEGLPAWPVSYTQFLPCYEAAEKLFRIDSRKEVAERRFSEWDRALMAHLRSRGLDPQPLQVAIRYDEACQECIGVVCPRGCKADARSVCLNEALRHSDVAVLDRCDVLALEADASRVQAVRAMHQGQELKVRAKVVVLSAGAMHSPQILLKSAGPQWPNGLANSSGQVGRNLMFHTSDLYAVFAPRQLARATRQKKSISIRDFYVHGGRRLGYVQSMGLEVGAGAVAVHLKNVLRRRGVRNELLLKLLVKLPSLAAALLLGNASVFAAMTEDDPNPDNRIVLDPGQPDGASFQYRITEDLMRRADALREVFTRTIQPWRLFRLSNELIMNYGHPCGTCRFGEDRATSVLDADCKAHDVENLYVVDASFMPRSGAVNPSLTIAANALRVASRIAENVAAQAARL